MAARRHLQGREHLRENTITLLELGDITADFDDFAGDVCPKNERELLDE